jgi:uncharacterized membrane protein YecN with MAPEG domain
MHAPITALWAGLLGILMLGLAGRVVNARNSEKILFGDGGNVLLQQHVRVHGNFIEYVPLGLVLLLILELNGASPLLLNGLGGTLFVARLLHAFGLTRTTGTSFGRFVGTVLTWLVLFASSALALYSYTAN